MTDKEWIVRNILRRNKFWFTPQKIFKLPNNQGFYLVDFYLKTMKLCIEIDGREHLTSQIDRDVKRTLFLECDKELKVIRFRNDEVEDTSKFEDFLLSEIEAKKLRKASPFKWDKITTEYMNMSQYL